MLPAIFYTKRVQGKAEFCAQFFGYEAITRDGDPIVELRPCTDGLTILLHRAGMGQRDGQSLVKLVFDVEDVGACRDDLNRRGLLVGPIHEVDGYQFANAKEPSNNAISSRVFADDSQ